MNFSFSLDLYNETLLSASDSFFELTNFPKETKSLPLYRIFPAQSFIEYLFTKFGAGEKTFPFYTYIFTNEGRRIRVSGIAHKTKYGYEFFCKAETPANKTLVEEEEKISIFEIINAAAKKFMSETDWKLTLKETFKAFLPALNASRICLYRNIPNADGDLEAALTIEAAARSRKSILRKGREILPYSAKGLANWLKEFEKNRLVSSIFEELPPHEQKLFKEHHFTSLLAIPVFINTSLFGFLLFERGETAEEKWTPDEKSILSSFSSLLGIAIKSEATYKKLLETEEKLSLITKRTAAVLYGKRFGKKKFDYITDSIKNLTGYSKEEINAMGLNSLILEISKERFKRISSTTVDDFPVETDYLIRTKDGKEKWIADQKFSWKNSNNNVIGEIGILKDITERKRFESDLQKTNEILSAIVEFSQSLLSNLDYSKNILAIMENLGKATSVSRIYIYEAEGSEDSLTLYYKYEWSAPGIVSRAKKIETEVLKVTEQNFPALKHAIEQDNYYCDNTTNLGKKERRFFESVKTKSFLIVPIRTNGALYGIIGLDDCKNEREWSKAEIDAIKIAARIIGAAIRMERFVTELEKAKDEAQKSAQLKDNFLSQISHEIRTPLNNIISYLGMLSDSMSPDLRKENELYFNGIFHGTKRLKRTIELLINASELQLNTFKPRPKKFEVLKEIVLPMFNEFESFATAKGIEFSYSCNPEKITLENDNYAVTKILEHLIDNAIKYTDKGFVKLECYEEGNNVVLLVKDTGIGIAPEYRKNIFEIFTQESTGRTRKYEGNGLGMYIVKKFADLCGVNISFTSRKNSGTTFTLKIPKRFQGSI